MFDQKKFEVKFIAALAEQVNSQLDNRHELIIREFNNTHYEDLNDAFIINDTKKENIHRQLGVKLNYNKDTEQIHYNLTFPSSLQTYILQLQNIGSGGFLPLPILQYFDINEEDEDWYMIPKHNLDRWIWFLQNAY